MISLWHQYIEGTLSNYVIMLFDWMRSGTGLNECRKPRVAMILSIRLLITEPRVRIYTLSEIDASAASGFTIKE